MGREGAMAVADGTGTGTCVADVGDREACTRASQCTCARGPEPDGQPYVGRWMSPHVLCADWITAAKVVVFQFQCFTT